PRRSSDLIKNSLVASSPSVDLTAQASAKDDRNEFTWKPEFHVTPNDRLTFTFGTNRNPRLTPFPFTTSVPGYPHTTTVKSYYATASYAKTFSATLLNEFRCTAQRNNTFQSAPAADFPVPNALGINSFSYHLTCPLILGFNC